MKRASGKELSILKSRPQGYSLDLMTWKKHVVWGPGVTRAAHLMSTGHLLPRTNGSQMLKGKFTAGRRGTKCCGGSRHHLVQHKVTYGLWIENRGEKNQRLHSWARERPTGVGAAAEGPHAAILLIVLSGPITKKAMIGEATPTREMWVPRQDWGSVQGVLR